MVENAIKDYLVNQPKEIIAVWDWLIEFYQLPLKYLSALSDEAKFCLKYILKKCGHEISTIYGMKTVGRQYVYIDHETSRFYKTFLYSNIHDICNIIWSYKWRWSESFFLLLLFFLNKFDL